MGREYFTLIFTIATELREVIENDCMNSLLLFSSHGVRDVRFPWVISKLDLH